MNLGTRFLCISHVTSRRIFKAEPFYLPRTEVTLETKRYYFELLNYGLHKRTRYFWVNTACHQLIQRNMLTTDKMTYVIQTNDPVISWQNWPIGHNVESSKTPFLQVTISPVVQHADDPAWLHEAPLSTPAGVAAVPIEISVLVMLGLRAKTVFRKTNAIILMTICIVLRKSELNGCRMVWSVQY